MPIQQVLPEKKEKEENIILIHRIGVIISIHDDIYQVKIFRQPKRKIFSTSLEGAYKILQHEEQKIEFPGDFCYQEEKEVRRII